MKALVSLSILLTGLAVPAGEAFAQAFVRGGADSVSVHAAVEGRTREEPGDVVAIAVAFRHAPGFHSWPNQPVVPPEFEGVNPIPTTIEVISLPAAVELEEIEWPEPVLLTVRYTGRPVQLLSYADTTVARVRLRLPGDAPADDPVVELEARYQSCDERVCYPPRTKRLRVQIPIGRRAGRP
jgi:hypothetical protein